MSILNIVIVIISSFFASFGQVLLKIGATSSHTIKDFLNYHIAFGLMLYGLGAILWIYVLSREELTKVFPFTILTFVITYFMGVYYLDEYISKFDIIGVVFVLSGLLIIVNN